MCFEIYALWPSKNKLKSSLAGLKLHEAIIKKSLGCKRRSNIKHPFDTINVLQKMSASISDNWHRTLEKDQGQNTC